jgi:hypothetical protein
MLSGTVNTVTAAQALDAAKHVLRAPRRNVIKVKSYNVPTGDGVSLAAVALKRTGYKTADVLKVVLLRLFIAEILLKCFSASDRCAELLNEL